MMRLARAPTPTWRAPQPFGYPEAIQSVGLTVAPLLCGFTVTLIALIVNSKGTVAHPNVALVLLTAAVVSLLGAIQCAYSARVYLVTPDRIAAFRPEIAVTDDTRRARWEEARAEQFGCVALHDRWAARTRRCFLTGTLALLLALMVVLIPPPGPDKLPVGRVLAICVLGVGFVMEIGWMGAAALVGRWDRTDRGWKTRPRPGPLHAVAGAVAPPFEKVYPADVRFPHPPPPLINDRRLRVRLMAQAIPAVLAAAAIALLLVESTEAWTVVTLGSIGLVAAGGLALASLAAARWDDADPAWVRRAPPRFWHWVVAAVVPPADVVIDGQPAPDQLSGAVRAIAAPSVSAVTLVVAAVVSWHSPAVVILAGVAAGAAAVLLWATVAGRRRDRSNPRWRVDHTRPRERLVDALSRPAIAVAPNEETIRSAAHARWEKLGGEDPVALWLGAETQLRRERRDWHAST